MSNAIQQGYRFQSVTPSDTNDITPAGSTINPSDCGVCLYVGTGGNIKVDSPSGDTVTFANVPDGTFMPIQVKRVYSTGTTASDIIALF